MGNGVSSTLREVKQQAQLASAAARRANTPGRRLDRLIQVLIDAKIADELTDTQCARVVFAFMNSDGDRNG